MNDTIIKCPDNWSVKLTMKMPHFHYLVVFCPICKLKNTLVKSQEIFVILILIHFSSKGSLSQYLPESRNFLKISGRNRFLHKSRENIINFLEKLPKTKHDLGSFHVDVPLANVSRVILFYSNYFTKIFFFLKVHNGPNCSKWCVC